MKRKYIIPTILSLCIGSYLGYLLFNQYKNNEMSVLKQTNIIYFLQQGVYSNIESINDNTSLLSDYIYIKLNDKYYVYVGMTTDYENATKIKNSFEKKGYDIYIKEENINNDSFFEKLKQYDELIKVSNDETAILGIIKQILGEYELVIKGEE